MDQHHLTDLRRSLRGVPSRRDVLRGLAGAGLGLGALRLSDPVEAKNKKKGHKQRKKTKRNKSTQTPQGELPPLVFNQYGCLDVGQPCRGDNANCCSGICQGTAPGAGQPDTSTCVAHNAGGCVVGGNSCAAGVPVQCNASKPDSVCLRTTGNAGFCGGGMGNPTEHCRVCAKDADCQAEFGPGAACVVFDATCAPICGITGLTACVPPSI